MGTEARFVDVTYRGLKVATKAKLVEIEGMTGFVELEAPMPVGTRVTMVDGAETLNARVLGVVEQESGAKSPPGMRVTWADVAEKPVVPEVTQPDIPLVTEAEAQAIYEAEASPVETAAGAATDAPADASGSPAESSTSPAEDGPNGGRRRRKTKRTQVGRP